MQSEQMLIIIVYISFFCASAAVAQRSGESPPRYDSIYDRTYTHDIYNRKPGEGSYREGIGSGNLDPEILRRPRHRRVETAKGEIVGTVVLLWNGPWKEFTRDSLVRDSARIPYLNATVFLGIPYAEPITRDRRFKPPLEKAAWRPETLHALSYRPACPQPQDHVGSERGVPAVAEDCLYLNVFSPNLSRAYGPFPVMIYIHGGEFTYGSSNLYPGHMLAASQGVVVVTFNYRLGVLGFLASGDIHSPGNYGMLDQVMAIRWVHDNIDRFNGDPRRITLFGSGAGAAAVGMHTLSSPSKEFFQRAIAMSGSEVASWAAIRHWEHALNNTRRFSQAIGCRKDPNSRQSTYQIVECLRSRSALELGKTTYKPDIGLFGWAPTVDVPSERAQIPAENRFLPNAPQTLLENGVFSPEMPFLAGVTSGEGEMFLLSDEKLRKRNFIVNQQTFKEAIRRVVFTENYTEYLKDQAVEQAIEFMYDLHAGGNDRLGMRREELVNVYSDAYFVGPMNLAMSLRARRGVRQYQYLLNASCHADDAFGKFDWQRVPHGEEIFFVFGFPFLNNDLLPVRHLRQYQWTQHDRNMSDIMMQMMANFARESTPTPSRVYNTTWQPYSSEHNWYLVLNTTNTSFNYENYRPRLGAFWTDYLPGQYAPSTPSPYATDHPILQDLTRWRVVSGASVFFLIFSLIILLITCVSYHRYRHNVESNYWG